MWGDDAQPRSSSGGGRQLVAALPQVVATPAGGRCKVGAARPAVRRGAGLLVGLVRGQAAWRHEVGGARRTPQ